MNFFQKRWAVIVFLAIFFLHFFLRFYQLEARTEFRWDQVDNAWAAKNIIVDHKFPLLGMQAKQNTGFYIGPAYYYFITPFYWFFKLDPIASGVVAGVTSIFTFFGLFYLTKKLFFTPVAFMSIFLYTVNLSAIQADRSQWPINFIPLISLLIFYSLYQVITGKPKYLILLALSLGFSFHLNFTSILFPLIIFLTLPFFPRTRETVKYGLIAFPFFLLWLVPNFLSEIINEGSSGRNMFQYINTYYHGFHLRRILQVANEAFLEFETILTFLWLKPLKYIILPLFTVVYLGQKLSSERLKVCYLMGLWIIVPWMVFSTYSGEITNYYFTLLRPIAIITLSCIIVTVFKLKGLAPKLLVGLFLLYYVSFNSTNFMKQDIQGLDYHRAKTLEAIREERIIEFQQGVPESFIYYYYTRKDKK